MNFIECTCVVVIFYIITYELKIAFRSYIGLKSIEEIIDENNNILKKNELELCQIKHDLQQIKYDLKMINLNLQEIKIDLV